MVKKLTYGFLHEADRERAIKKETGIMWWVSEKADAPEGVMAFLEKRAPQWQLSKHMAPPAEEPG